MEIIIEGATISLLKGDITLEETDIIVNAANSRLAGGGGVDGAIHRAGGPAIMEECRKIGGCPTGSAVMTTGGKLSARFVIHAVGPIYKDGLHNEPMLLESAYRGSLKLAVQKGVGSIAFPSISTGAYGYPVDAASKIALSTVLDFVGDNKGSLDLVRFVLFSDPDYGVYSRTLRSLTE
ncbi:MAG: O-acetyl-ADP-ribose deacetylase [Deltaproteobacteria bacterium]|nr:O-acetyl-ADP-ribose deacetylase [Deltaproteobacteria bacterium]MCL4873214.1 O-acetyl-ADP-ribose deacetylase [bacterium]